MQTFREIKWNRLLIAISAIVLMADTVPHPGLAPGVVQRVVSHFSAKPATLPQDYFSGR